MCVASAASPPRRGVPEPELDRTPGAIGLQHDAVISGVQIRTPLLCARIKVAAARPLDSRVGPGTDENPGRLLVHLPHRLHQQRLPAGREASRHRDLRDRTVRLRIRKARRMLVKAAPLLLPHGGREAQIPDRPSPRSWRPLAHAGGCLASSFTKYLPDGTASRVLAPVTMNGSLAMSSRSCQTGRS
jgi:hypothetical protein